MLKRSTAKTKFSIRDLTVTATSALRPDLAARTSASATPTPSALPRLEQTALARAPYATAGMDSSETDTPVKVQFAPHENDRRFYTLNCKCVPEIPTFEAGYLLMSHGMALMKVPFDANAKAKGRPIVIKPNQVSNVDKR
jgi:hypothetical protein